MVLVILIKRKGHPSITQNTACANNEEHTLPSGPRVFRSKIGSKMPSTSKKTRVFLFQYKKSYPLHHCRSANIGAQIAEIVKTRDNEIWKICYVELLNETYALSRYILYHNKCMTEQQKNCKLRNVAPAKVNDKNDTQSSVNFIKLQQFSAVTNFKRGFMLLNSLQLMKQKRTMRLS